MASLQQVCACVLLVVLGSFAAQSQPIPKSGLQSQDEQIIDHTCFTAPHLGSFESTQVSPTLKCCTIAVERATANCWFFLLSLMPLQPPHVLLVSNLMVLPLTQNDFCSYQKSNHHSPIFCCLCCHQNSTNRTIFTNPTNRNILTYPL